MSKNSGVNLLNIPSDELCIFAGFRSYIPVSTSNPKEKKLKGT